MSITRFVGKPVGITVLAASALLLGAPAASAHEGHDPAPAPNIAKGDPQAGTQFFARHLDTYHFNHQLVGFTNAPSDPYGWATHHFTPTALETASRTVSPKDAPEVKGDTWKEKKAKAADGPAYGHPPSHDGEPLYAPVNPTAGADYLQKYSSDAKPDTVVPAGQEALRRTLNPTNDAPPVVNDDWSDKQPTDKSGTPQLLTADQAAPLANGSHTVGEVAKGAISTANGGDDRSLLPIGGIVPSK